MTESIATEYLSNMMNVTYIDPKQHPEMMFTNLGSMVEGGFDFPEPEKERFRNLNKEIKQLNEDIKKEIRKYDSVGVGGFDISNSSGFTQTIYISLILGGFVVLLGVLIKLLFTKKESLGEQMKREKKAKKEAKKQK